jgi:hypothetical protein
VVPPPFILIKGINHEKLNLYRTRAAVVEKISSEKIRRKELIMAVTTPVKIILNIGWVNFPDIAQSNLVLFLIEVGFMV